MNVKNKPPKAVFKKGKDFDPYLFFVKIRHFLQKRNVVKSAGTFSLSRKDFVL